MCGRVIDPNLRGTEMEISATHLSVFPRRYNVKPTQDVYVLLAGRLVMVRWGLIPSWHRGTLRDWKASTINARIEEAAEKPTFRGPWRHGRCLIPVGGYYEWTGTGSPRQPHVFLSATNAETLWLAGLFSLWNDLPTCTILTRAATASVAPIHDRMPVILDLAEREAWLAGTADRTLGADARVGHHPVRPFKATDDGPALIEEA